MIDRVLEGSRGRELPRQEQGEVADQEQRSQRDTTGRRGWGGGGPVGGLLRAGVCRRRCVVLPCEENHTPVHQSLKSVERRSCRDCTALPAGTQMMRRSLLSTLIVILQHRFLTEAPCLGMLGNTGINDHLELRRGPCRHRG